MTATIASLQKRLDKLDNTAKEPDLIELAIAKLSDKDLELLHEHTALRESGFDEEQNAQMMGDRYADAQEAAAHFQKNMQYLETERTYRTMQFLKLNVEKVI